MLATYCCTQSLTLSLVNTLSETSLEKMIFLFVIPQYSGNPAEEEVERSKATKGMEDTKWVIESKRSRAKHI